MVRYKKEYKRLKKVLRYLFTVVVIVTMIFITFITFALLLILNLPNPVVRQVSSRNFVSITEEEVIDILLESLEPFGFKTCEQFCPEIVVSLGPLQEGIAVDYTARLVLTNEHGITIAFNNQMWSKRYGYIRFVSTSDRAWAEREIKSTFQNQYGLHIDKVFFVTGSYANNIADYSRRLEMIVNGLHNQINDFKEYLSQK